MHRLRQKAKAKAGRLLRVLLVWVGAVPAGSGRALGRERHGLLLHGLDNSELPTQARATGCAARALPRWGKKGHD
jgi:hypothetical protein